MKLSAKVKKEVVLWAWAILILYGFLAPTTAVQKDMFFGAASCISAMIIMASTNTDDLGIKCLIPRNVVICFLIGIAVLCKMGQLNAGYSDLGLAWIMLSGFAYAAMIVLVTWKNFLVAAVGPILQ